MTRKPAAARKKPVERRMPVLEWAVAGFGLIVTLAALAVLAMAAIQPRTPPDLTARLIAVQPSRAGFTVEVEIVNDGRATAENVDVEGVLTPPSGPPETATASLDYVPGGGAETLTFQFRADPRAGDLDLTVRGWSDP